MNLSPSAICLIVSQRYHHGSNSLSACEGIHKFNPLLSAQPSVLLYSSNEIPCYHLVSKNSPKCRSDPWSSHFNSLWVAIFSYPYEFFMRFLKQCCVSDTQGNSQCEGREATNDQPERLLDQDQPSGGGEDMYSLALFLSLSYSLFFRPLNLSSSFSPIMHFIFCTSAIDLSLS